MAFLQKKVDRQFQPMGPIVFQIRLEKAFQNIIIIFLMNESIHPPIIMSQIRRHYETI